MFKGLRKCKEKEYEFPLQRFKKVPGDSNIWALSFLKISIAKIVQWHSCYRDQHREPWMYSIVYFDVLQCDTNIYII